MMRVVIRAEAGRDAAARSDRVQAEDVVLERIGRVLLLDRAHVEPVAVGRRRSGERGIFLQRVPVQPAAEFPQDVAGVRVEREA